ncbi:hypothetical protein, partial [Clostridium perfringens]
MDREPGEETTMRTLVWLMGTSVLAWAGNAQAQTAPSPQAPSPVEAATPQANATTTDGDIVVTARRRAETLLSVPIAVTAFTADKLAKSGAIDLTDIQNTTPNT